MSTVLVIFLQDVGKWNNNYTVPYINDWHVIVKRVLIWRLDDK